MMTYDEVMEAVERGFMNCTPKVRQKKSNF